jgi:hypothetical protein
MRGCSEVNDHIIDLGIVLVHYALVLIVFCIYEKAGSQVLSKLQEHLFVCLTLYLHFFHIRTVVVNCLLDSIGQHLISELLLVVADEGAFYHALSCTRAGTRPCTRPYTSSCTW